MPSRDEIVSQPVEKFDDFEQFQKDGVNQRDESEEINPVDKPSSEWADDESLKPAEPSLPGASDASAYIENSYVSKRPAVPVENPAAGPAAEKAATPTAVAETQLAPGTTRVAQRSSRRVRSRVEPARSDDAAKNAPVKSPVAGNAGQSLSAKTPTSEPAADVVTSTLTATPVMAKIDSTTAPAIPAVHRNLSSRRLAVADSSLPSFKIVPVVPTPDSTVLSPIHVEAGQGALIRFISDEKPDEVRVADEAATETTIRFR
jgi:hypothetical protein